MTPEELEKKLLMLEKRVTSMNKLLLDETQFRAEVNDIFNDLITKAYDEIARLKIRLSKLEAKK